MRSLVRQGTEAWAIHGSCCVSEEVVDGGRFGRGLVSTVEVMVQWPVGLVGSEAGGPSRPGADLLGLVGRFGDIGVMPVVVEDGVGGEYLVGVGDGGGDEGAVVLLKDRAVLELVEGAEGGMFGLAEGVLVELVVEVVEMVGGLAEGLLAEGAGVGLVQKFGVVVFETRRRSR